MPTIILRLRISLLNSAKYPAKEEKKSLLIVFGTSINSARQTFRYYVGRIEVSYLHWVQYNWSPPIGYQSTPILIMASPTTVEWLINVYNLASSAIWTTLQANFDGLQVQHSVSLNCMGFHYLDSGHIILCRCTFTAQLTKCNLICLLRSNALLFNA